METKSLPVREITDMRTFAEEMGQPPFDWNAFLAKPNKTDQEWSAACALAQNWVTCACGNQCAIIARYKKGDAYHAPGSMFDGMSLPADGTPKDKELRNLGKAFFFNISNHDTTAARATLAAIEFRSAEILAHGEGAQ